MQQSKIKVGIVGGTGYTGVELLRLLVLHPNIQLVSITSRSEAGQRVSDMFPSLRSYVDLPFTDPAQAKLTECDVVFFATPNGIAMQQTRALLDAGVRVIDLAADFRIQEIPTWEKWYGTCEWREASLKHQGASAYRWFLDQLVVVRDEGETRLGHVSRLVAETDGATMVSVRLWAGEPKVFAVRLVNPNHTEEAPVAALLLTETPEEPATLVLSPRAFVPNRIMRCDEPGPVRKFRLTRIIQRGGDFERAAFEEVDPQF